MTLPKRKPTPLPTFIARNLPIVRMQNRVFVVSMMIVLGLLLLPKAAMLMKLVVAIGLTLVNGLLWMWVLARLECPNCKQSLRYLNSTLAEVRYCPYCGCKYI
jgi:hypothetical protein